MAGDGVVPLIRFHSSRPVLAATADVEVWAGTAGPVEDALLLLDELDQRWGPGGELDAVARAPCGGPVTVGWDTLLMLGLTAGAGLGWEPGSRTLTRTGAVVLPDLPARRALAAELLLAELAEAGCAAASVAIGAYASTVGPADWFTPPA